MRTFDRGRGSECNEAVHETAAAGQLLVLHGDRFDAVIGLREMAPRISAMAPTPWLCTSNEVCHALRRALNLPYWSLSAWLKGKVKNALEYICRFEEAVAREVRARGFDGVGVAVIFTMRP